MTMTCKHPDCDGGAATGYCHVDCRPAGKITLRDDQQDAIAALRAAYAAGKRRIVMQAPTGMGKTILAGAMVKRALELGGKVLFTCPAISLIDQTVESLRSQGVEGIGVMQAAHKLTDPTQPVQVASVSTLARRELPEATVVFIDECHRWYEFYEGWMMDPAWADVPFIGLSATPWTKGLGKYYQELIIAGTTASCIDRGILSPFKVFAPSSPDLSGVKIVAGDYHEGQLSAVMQQQGLMANVIDTWLQKATGRPTLCFAVDCAHAQELQARFADAGVPCGYQDASTPMSERAEIKRKFHDGTYKVVCNVGTLTTGVDWDVRCISFARPTKSEMLFVQIIGRGLRIAPGKDYCLILDHSDNHSRLGFVTDIHHDKLDDTDTKVKGEAPVRICPECTAVNPLGARTCVECGFEFPRKDPTIEEAGELAELQQAKPLNEQPKASVYGQLMWIASERSYNPGWIAHKYREIYGIWPARVMGVVAEPPTKALLRFVKQQAKAWKAEKKAAEMALRPIIRPSSMPLHSDDEDSLSLPWHDR